MRLKVLCTNQNEKSSLCTTKTLIDFIYKMESCFDLIESLSIVWNLLFFIHFALLSFLFCYWIVVLSALRWKKLACVLYEVTIFEFKKMKVALICIECVLAFMEYFDSYSWVDNLKGSFICGSCRNWKFYHWIECVWFVW